MTETLTYKNYSYSVKEMDYGLYLDLLDIFFSTDESKKVSGAFERVCNVLLTPLSYDSKEALVSGQLMKEIRTVTSKEDWKAAAHFRGRVDFFSVQYFNTGNEWSASAPDSTVNPAETPLAQSSESPVVA